MAIPTKLTLEIVTPDRSLLREEVDEVVVPGTEGELGILPGHTPLLSTLKIGELWYRQGPNDPDPTNQTVNNGCGLPFCDSSGHCAVATRC